MDRTVVRIGGALVLAASLSAGAWAAEPEKAPMPQTKGMQGMDPALHDRPAEKRYEDCKPNPKKAAQQAAHPMPQTKGMQGMDPKMHEVDCPEPTDERVKPAHVHRGTGG
jgi:hypothetical protein